MLIEKKKILKKIMVLMFILLIYFVIAEHTVRFEKFGTNAFSPEKMVNIKFSRSYEYYDKPCDLKANYSDYYKGAYTQTNSYGLSDKEYSLEKNENTFRISVIGDSTTAGTGVVLADVYHTIFEERLNNRSINTSFEVINFGTGGISGIKTHHCYFKKINDSLHFDTDIIIIQLFKSDSFLMNETNVAKVEDYRENAHILFMFFGEENDYIREQRNKTDIPIISLNVTHTPKDDVYPADWHPNEKIHKKYADSLYDYFIANEGDMYKRTSNLIRNDTFPEIVIPPEPRKKNDKDSELWTSFYFEKIEKRYEVISNDMKEDYAQFLEKIGVALRSLDNKYGYNYSGI